MLRRLLNLSFRYKIPLWGSVLIVGTALCVSATLLYRAWADVRADLLHNAASLGSTLAVSLFKPMLHDDVWRTFEIVNSPLLGATQESPVLVDTLLVVNPEGQVYVSTRPEQIQMLVPMARISSDFAALAAQMPLFGTRTQVFDIAEHDYLFVVTPIAEESAQLGWLIQRFQKSALLPRFLESADRAAMMAGMVLTILLPINWYWGRRTAEPLAEVAARMEKLAEGEARPLSEETYGYEDEIGRLFRTYNRTAEQLREKASLEQEVLRSERLAAIGRLTAGIAHEVNNPLAGMITAIDNLRQRPDLDPKVAKTVGLIERGLAQIADTVRALLVEAKVQSRALSAEDIADVQTLLHAQIARRRLRVDWHVTDVGELPVPASMFRQVLINLLLNAIQAAPVEGGVGVSLSRDARELTLDVWNEGAPIADDVLQHLFEPFVSTKASGHGLGLWVTYQMVQQLHGRIWAANEDGRVRFSVRLPLEPVESAT